jgi:hypothetical protein
MRVREREKSRRGSVYYCNVIIKIITRERVSESEATVEERAREREESLNCNNEFNFTLSPSEMTLNSCIYMDTRLQ